MLHAPSGSNPPGNPSPNDSSRDVSCPFQSVIKAVETNSALSRDVSDVTGAPEARDNLGSAVGLLEGRAHKKFRPAKKGNCKHPRSVEPLTKRTDIVQLHNGITGINKVNVGSTRSWN